ncbi:hypothetical protein ACPD1F_003559 [Vibrio cholerae]
MEKNKILTWSEIVRYEEITEQIIENYPMHSDYYYLLGDIMKVKKLSTRVLGISGVLPVKNPISLTKMNFISVNTNKTKYAALKEVQSVFGEFYNESGIFPVIQVLPKEFLVHPNLAPNVYRRLRERGTLLYGTKR